MSTMPRSHTSFTSSPNRPRRSPVRSPSRKAPSTESHYELDLDALGLNSTSLDTVDMDHGTALEAVQSEIEGPDDFTMNMTHWMMGDLSQSPIQSRKEAYRAIEDSRQEIRHDSGAAEDASYEGDHPILEESTTRSEPAAPRLASPMVHVNEHRRDKALSETSMEHEEKVLSYLDALPDTDVGDAYKSTPLRLPKTATLQVPAKPKSVARSFQPTVEDYTDTPKKASETVVHHVLEGPTEPTEYTVQTEQTRANEEELRARVKDLEDTLEHQQLTSKTRITELETMLSFTRDELDITRSDSYRLKEQVSELEKENEEWERRHEALSESVDTKLKQQEEALNSRMQEYGEELQLQSQAKLQNQQEEFEKQLRAVQEEKTGLEAELERKENLLAQFRTEVEETKQSRDEALESLESLRNAFVQDKKSREDYSANATAQLSRKLTSLQNEADMLQSKLERATAEAQVAREELAARAEIQTWALQKTHSQVDQIRELESQVASLQKQLDTPRADSAKGETGDMDMSELNERISSLEEELNQARSDLASNDQEIIKIIQEHEQLEQNLHALHSDQAARDASRISELELHIFSLQDQLNASRSDLAAKDEHILKCTKDHERLEEDLRASRTESTSNEAARISELESRVSSLQKQLDTSRADLAAKDLEILNGFQEHERLEQQLSTSQGRVEGLEKTIITLRQQLAESYKETSKIRTETQRLEDDLRTSKDLLQDVQRHADARVAEFQKKLEKMKETKADLEKQLQRLQAEKEDRIEDHETDLHDIRSKAEDAVKKVAALLEEERSAKKKLLKELKTVKTELEDLRSAAAQNVSEDSESYEPSDDEDDDSEEEDFTTARSHSRSRSPEPDTRDTQLSQLRTLLQQQLQLTKSLKATNNTLRSEISSLKSAAETRETEFEAVNRELDGRLAALVRELVKERAKVVVGMRDQQWGEKVGQLKEERDRMGKVLLREWGKEECGMPAEGEKQRYRYRFVRRGNTEQ